MTQSRGVRCLDEDLGDYAGGRLEPVRRRRWDLHLVTCRGCARAVEDERRLQAAFAGAPSMPGDLRAALLALAGGHAFRDAAEGDPEPPPVRRRDPLLVLSPGAPPCHRSALRATVIAAAAAGASAAAALSLTVISAPASRTGVTASTVVPVVGSPTPSPFSAVTTVVPVRWARPGAAAPSSLQAESRP
ncbi:MAG: hypothetical protein ABIU87_08140 [Ornithinibacter sp.]